MDKILRAATKVRDLARQVEETKQAIDTAEFFDRGPLSDKLSAIRVQHHLAKENLLLEADGNHDTSTASYE